MNNTCNSEKKNKKRITVRHDDEISKFDSLASDWIDNCIIRNLSPVTIENYKGTITLYKKANPNGVALTSKCVDNFILYCHNRNNTNNSIKCRLRALKVLFKYAEIEIKFPQLKTEKNIIVPYSSEEVSILLAKPKRKSFTQYRNHAIVATLLGTGMRCRTLINLRIQDILWESNSIYLNVTKTNKKYYLPLSTELRKILRNYLSLFNYVDTDFLFPNLYGDQLTSSTLKSTLREYNLQRGISTIGIHRFRHTFASGYLKNGGNLAYLQEILGHSDISTT